ncbi:MAG: hypothetical protein U0T75_00070 [Chitinophagales bacterium]
MSKLHIFIDGTWLFKIGKAEGALASRTVESSKPFPLNFEKLKSSILNHVKAQNAACDTTGDLYYVTSIFDIPPTVDAWPENIEDITEDNIKKTKSIVFIKTKIAENAVRAGFKSDAIYKPTLKPYMVRKLARGDFQEKQVDASVVALLVRSAITKPDDFHCVITGDSDIIPAIKVAYPEYSQNVVIATLHPDELKAENRQSSYSYADFSFDVDPYYLQEHIVEIIHGTHPYICKNCHRAFVQTKAVPKGKMAYCPNCASKRT